MARSNNYLILRFLKKVEPGLRNRFLSVYPWLLFFRAAGARFLATDTRMFCNRRLRRDLFKATASPPQA